MKSKSVVKQLFYMKRDYMQAQMINSFKLMKIILT